MKSFKYKTTFASIIKCLVDEEKDNILAKASLDNLKSFIPNDITKQIDLLAIAFNSCTPNMGNKNGDMIDANTALEIYKGFIHRPINIEHSRRDGAFGHIVSAGFSKYSADYSLGKGSEIIEASEIKDKKYPINLSLAGVLYRLYQPDLIKYIEESSDPDSEEYMKISASWELMFNDFDIAVGSKYLSECEIITDEKEKDKLSKYLLGEGGNGKTPDGKPLYRLVRGEVYPVGIGLTENPAGYLAGIYTETEKESMKANINDAKKSKISSGACPKCGAEMDMEDETDDEMEMECAECKNKSKAKNWKIKDNKASFDHFIEKCQCGEVISQCRCPSNDKKIIISKEKCGKCDKNEKSLSQSSQHVVKANDNNSTKIMKVKNINDLTDESLKEVKASEVQELFANSMKEKIDAEIKKISDDFEAKKTEKEKAIKAANEEIVKLGESVKSNEEKYNAVQAELTKIKEEYDKLVKANEEKTKLEVFSARLQTLDEQFNLSEDEKKIVGDELKNIDTDEAFAKYQAKMDVLLAKSKKVFDPKTKKWVNKEDVKTEKTEAKASTNVVEEVKKEEKVVTAQVPNTSTVTETIADKAKKAFGASGWDSKFIKNVEK